MSDLREFDAIHHAHDAAKRGSTEQPTPYTREEFERGPGEAFRDVPDTHESVEIRGSTLLRLLATCRQGIQDSERLDWLEQDSPFLRHSYAGHAEATLREQIDKQRASTTQLRRQGTSDE